MYKHLAESIKETNDKMFVSLEEKTKYNNYENTMRRKDDSYSKTEVDNKIKELSDNTYGNVEDTYISESNTLDGYVKDLEILGNTIQNQDNLADIKSVGELQEDGNYKMSIVSCGKNLFDIPKHYTKEMRLNGKAHADRIVYTKINKNTEYLVSCEYLKDNGVIGHGGIEIALFKNEPSETDHWFLNQEYKRILSTEHYSIKLSQVFNSGEYNYVAVYLGIATNSNYDTTMHIKNLFLTVNTGDVSYSEKFKESRVDISLPCQLEKVGDISDRLYYDEEEKAWCIEKNIEKIIFTGSDNEGWTHKPSYVGNGKQYYGTPNDGYTFKVAGGISEFPVYNGGGGARDHNGTAMSCSKQWGTIDYSVNIATLSEFKTWVNGKSIYVVPETSKKIILPLSTQIQLNSYANKTHIYTLSGEIEGTIKATLPKSLSASVQSLNDKTDMMENRIKDIETLKEGQNISYESDKGYVLCENTNNGQIDNIKIEGKTLVNRKFNTEILNKSNAHYYDLHLMRITGIVPDKVYTISYDFDCNVDFNMEQSYIGYGPNTEYMTVESRYRFYPKIGRNTVVFSFTKEDIDNMLAKNCTDIQIRIFIDSEKKPKTFSIRNIILLDGEQEHNLPLHFQGIKSVGSNIETINVFSSNNIYDIVVSSVQIDNNKIQHHLKKYIYNNFTIYNPHNATLSVVVFKGDRWSRDILAGKGDNYIQLNEGEYVNYFNQYFSLGWDITDRSKLQDMVISLKSHNKPILYYNNDNELVPIDELHEWDSVKKHNNGKWYYHKKTGKVVLNGNENWQTWNYIVDGDIDRTFNAYVNVSLTEKKSTEENYINILSDILPTSRTNFIERRYNSILTSSEKIHVCVEKSQLSQPSIDGLKEWLSKNNVTVLYKLKDEEIYECENLILEGYDNKTLVSCNAGIINPIISFNITSHIGDTISILRETLKNIEEKYTNYKIMRNKLLLDSMYKSSKSSFDMSILERDTVVEEIDYDLFDLSKSVIEIGLNNYDVTYMEELIDFYTMVGKFDYYMADILFEMIENQINPVIEIPEEEIEVLI